MKLPTSTAFNVNNQKGFSQLILAIILGILPFLLLAFAFAAHAESTSETPKQLCDDARRDGSYTILEDTQDKCTYVSPGVIKIEHFYQGNKLCLRTTGFKDTLTLSLDADGEITTECFDRTREVAKQPSLKPTTAPEAKILVFGTDVKAGDTVTAEGKSKAVVFLSEGGRVDLKEGAKIKFHSEDEIETISGVFKFLIKRIRGNPKIIRSGDAVIAVRGTEFLVEVGNNGTKVKVIEGAVEVSNTQSKGTVQVATGQETKTVKGGLPTKPKTFDPKTLENWWEGLPKEAPSDSSDFWVGLVAFGVLGAGIYWVFRRIKNASRGKGKSKTVSAVAALAAPATSKRSFILRWGNIIFLVLMIVFALLIIISQDANPVIAFGALNAFYLVVLSAIVLSIIRIFKKYHLFRSFIWLLIIPIVALLLILSFLPPMK